MHVPRRLYEGLPWLYITLGLAALAYSYLASGASARSLIAGLAGLAGVLAGAVLLLRRREFRALGRRYGTGGTARGRQPGDAPRPPPDRDFD